MISRLLKHLSLLGASLVVLLWSFGKSVTWLWRARGVHSTINPRGVLRPVRMPAR